MDEVRNEVEALMLEWSLIKQHQPRFNVRLRDDKSYPFLAVTVDEEWPRAMVIRGRKRKGIRYFGPYAHAYAIRETLDQLLRSFPIRTCRPASSTRTSGSAGRACSSTSRSAPARASVSRSVSYRQLVDELCDFLAGDTDEIVKRLETAMGRPRARSSSSVRPASGIGSPRCARRSPSSRWWLTATRTSM